MILNGAEVSTAWNLSEGDGKQFASPFLVRSYSHARLNAIHLRGEDKIIILKMLTNIANPEKRYVISSYAELTAQSPSLVITDQGKYLVAREVDLSSRQLYAKKATVIVEIYQGYPHG